MTIGKMSLDRQLKFFQQKFPKADSSIVVRALGYFSDVENGQMPHMVAPTKWEEVKSEAVSTGQRNVECLSRRAEVQCLSWAAVETASYCVQLRLAVTVNGFAFG
jgi:hypothetical protein